MADDKLKGQPIPQKLEDRLKRGREAMLRDAPDRRLASKFERGDQYWGLNGKGQLIFQDTVSHVYGGKRPPHRIRNKYNFIQPIVEAKISQATQRVPSYEVVPSTTDPEDRSAAKVAEKVALYGYDQWRVRRATMKIVKHALVMGEGFAMPYFDPSVAPFIPDPEDPEKRIGQGEVKILTFSANQVYWEAGVEFNESRWWAVEKARTVEDVESIPGFVGGKLTPDATAHDVPTESQGPDLVLTTEYIERPSQDQPEGRKLIMANKQVITPPEAYPCRDANGVVADMPVLHRLSYIIDPDSDRDRGLVFALIDLQRTINDCWSKILEWKNRCLNPQIMAPVGSIINRKDDQPGAIVYYRPVGGQVPTWESPPAVPRELFQILEQAIQHMRAIAADVDPQAEPDVAARTVQAVIEQSNQRWQSFLGDLSEFHAQLMRHCLYLVSAHYSEPRLMAIKGTFGAEAIEDFKGSDLKNQIDVRVFPQSLEVKSRKAITEETLAFADRGWITGEAAMARVNGGVGDVLGNQYEYDVRRANLIIQKIRQGPDVLFATPKRLETVGTDPVTGQPQEMEVPGWLPRKFDNADVWEQVLTTWMKTEEYDRLEPGMQEAAMKAYEVLQQLKMQQQALAVAAQTAMAEQQGAENAARPQGPKPSPDQKMPDLPPES